MAVQGALNRPLDDNETHAKGIFEQRDRAETRAGEGLGRVILPDARQKAATCRVQGSFTADLSVWTRITGVDDSC